MVDRPIGRALDPKHNSLNFLRLLLALGVVYSHACELGWLGYRNIVIHGTSLGTISVYGFFGISGYLIAGSATKNGFGRYLWQRFLRILPAFWICLLVTAFVIAPTAWLLREPVRCHLGCYINLRPGPFSYVYSNVFLKINQPWVTRKGPAAYISNFSLWTLLYEFLCYLFVGILAAAGFLRHRKRAAAVTLILAGILATTTLDHRLNGMFTVTENTIPMQFMVLSIIFMGGSLIYLYRDRLPDSGILAVICLSAFVGSLYLPTYGHTPTQGLTASSLGAVLIAYPILWLGAHLPCQRIGAKNDYSYGIYIYAFPVTCLLVVLNGDRLGFVPFMIVTVLLTVPFAIASWWLIEKRVLQLKKIEWPPWRSARIPSGEAAVVSSALVFETGESMRRSHAPLPHTRPPV